MILLYRQVFHIYFDEWFHFEHSMKTEEDPCLICFLADWNSGGQIEPTFNVTRVPHGLRQYEKYCQIFSWRTELFLKILLIFLVSGKRRSHAVNLIISPLSWMAVSMRKAGSWSTGWPHAPWPPCSLTQAPSLLVLW